MNTKLIKEYKKTLKLSERQREIITGLLLGDGHFETRNGQIYRLKVEHSIKQKEYVDWLYQNFINLTNQPPKAREKTSFDKKIISYGFTTYSSGSFRFYGQQFYLGNKKIIPKNIKKLLSPLSLAIWFMDDGSLKSIKHRAYIIHTLGYDLSELQIMEKALMEKFGIKIKIHKQYNKWRIYIPAESYEKFRKLIKSHIIESMKYKLG